MLGRLHAGRDNPSAAGSRAFRWRPAHTFGEAHAQVRALDPHRSLVELEVLPYRRLPSIWLATFNSFPRTASAATWADEPAITACRLLKPPKPSAIASVVAGG